MSARIVLIMLAVTSLLQVSPSVGAERAPGTTRNSIVVEREKRFLQRADEDLGSAQKQAEEDIAALEQQRDAITPLEPSRRAQDISDLLEWYYRYRDFLVAGESDLEAEFAALSAPRARKEEEVGDFAGMSEKSQELAAELKEKVSGYRVELDRLAGIIERRRVLQSQFHDLQAKLARLARHEEEEGEGSPGREREREHLRREVKVVQTELLSLPDIDEEILKHYAVMIEQGRWEGEWLALDVVEFRALGNLAVLIPSNQAGSIPAMLQAYQHLSASYEGEIATLNRMLDELDRVRSRVSPAGTLREMDRSRDLQDLYERQRKRGDARIRELRTRIGACDAEIAELRSLQP